jgi:hypothetical protein
MKRMIWKRAAKMTKRKRKMMICKDSHFVVSIYDKNHVLTIVLNSALLTALLPMEPSVSVSNSFLSLSL